MVRFRVHSDGAVLIPDEPVELPKGGRFMVTLEPATMTEQADTAEVDWFEKALELADRMPATLPEDLAEQHDHYIHGTPKR